MGACLIPVSRCEIGRRNRCGLLDEQAAGGEGDLLLLELANTSSAGSAKSMKGSKAIKPVKVADEPAVLAKAGGADMTVAEQLATMSEPLAVLLASLEDYVFSLGDDVQRKDLKLYIAFKRLKNFATVVPQKGRLLLYLHLDVDQIAAPPAIGRDVRQQGHWGTGDMELSLTKAADLDLIKPLILLTYEGRAGVVSAPASASL